MSPCPLHRYVPWSLFPSGFLTKPLPTLLFSPRHPVPHLFSHPWFENHMYIWRELQILKLIITQFSLSSCYFCHIQVFLSVPSSGTFSVYDLLLMWQIKFHTCANSRQNYNFIHCSLLVLFFFLGYISYIFCCGFSLNFVNKTYNSLSIYL